MKESMKITYLGHSGFCVETDKSCLLFDYYRGRLPEKDTDLKKKKWYVFSSHNHSDHFNPEIFDLMEEYGDVTYIFSNDIKRKLRFNQNIAGDREICYVKSDEKMDFDNISVTTFRSTDQGVAFLVNAEGKLLYHAGDLNWWHWEGESRQYNNNMAARFKKEVGKIKEEAGNTAIDAAFLPLDPRLEASCYMGMKYFLENVRTIHVFPMHFWDKPDVIPRFIKEYGNGLLAGINSTGNQNETEGSMEMKPVIHEIKEDGQVFII